MILRHFLLQVNDTNAYVAACSETRAAMIVDPGEANPDIAEFLSTGGLHPVLIAVTHDHYDHTGGVESFAERYDIEVVSRAGTLGGSRGRSVRDGERLRIGALDVTVLETPGHTPDAISLAVEDVVFTGDAIFAGSLGGTAGQTEFDEEVRNVRAKILSAPGGTRLFPGHGPPSTVAVEDAFNPFL